MDFEQANRLSQEWGDKPCNHPNIEREYYPGTGATDYVPTKTGDWICTQCGKSFTREEKEAIEEARKDK